MKRVRRITGTLLFGVLGVSLFLFGALHARADSYTLYSQPDDSGELLSQQATFANTWISAGIGNLFLGKDRLSITFTMKDLHASASLHYPSGGVAVGTCLGCTDLQKYNFTDADRTILADHAFHTFTVQTGTTTLGIADGETPVYITFFGLSQYQYGTHLKSDAASTTPYLLIETAAQPTIPPVPQAPESSVTAFEQSDASGLMTNQQATFQNAYIDSASLGNLHLGKDKAYITFTIKDPKADNVTHTPKGVCLQPASSHGCTTRLQTYLFTDADRTLLADQAFHTFMVETGTTTNAYADGTQPVSIGFYGLSQYQYGTKIKSNADATIPAVLVQTPPPPDPCIAAGNCASNVLFLPGIEGSRLYEGTGCGKEEEEKLWEPIGESLWKILRGAGDKKVTELFLDESGESVCADIYAKADDVIDSVRGSNIYASFIDEMDGLAADGTIKDWKPVAYDWRLSLDDLLSRGAERDGKIYYTGGDNSATSTPYIEQTLRTLAGTSKTGKVTIVAHSNGGLLAKALLDKLGSLASKLLVDKVIMVGAPQSGAPVDVGALLYGYDQGISSHGIPILHSSIAQQLAENSPMAYHLLPSQSYFDSVMDDAAHPVARFAGDAYARELADYGNAIGTAAELASFIRASSLNAALIDYASGTHAALDSWVPPEGIEVSQVAGWGVDTVAGIDFYTPPPVSALSALEPTRAYRPIMIEDGDGTVPVPSALMMASSTSVKRYWVDLDSYRIATSIRRTHKDLFEIPSLEDFIKNLITNSTAALPAYLSTIQPSPTTDKKTLTFYLHSPLTLELTDSAGNVTGLAEDDSISQDILDSTYGEFGEVKYVTVPEGSYELTLHGQESGTFSLDIQESVGGVVTASSTIANVPTTDQTLASLTISGGLDTVMPLTVDSDGDGEADISLAPRAGETVSYEPPADPEPVEEPAPEPEPLDSAQGEPEPEPAPEPVKSSGGRGGGASSFFIAPAITEVATSTLAPIMPIAQPVATSTQKATTTTEVAQMNKKVYAPIAKVQKAVPQPKPQEAVAVVPQTASVYDASQQPLLKKLGTAVYNGLHGLWAALKKLF